MTEGRVLAVFQPHLYSRTRYLAHELGSALTVADAVCVTEIYAAREQTPDGVSGKLVVDAIAEARPGIDVGWTPQLDDAARFLVRRARADDAVVTLGAGDVDFVSARVLELLS